MGFAGRFRDHSWGDVNEIAATALSNSSTSSILAHRAASRDVGEKNCVEYVVPRAAAVGMQYIQRGYVPHRRARGSASLVAASLAHTPPFDAC